MYILTKLVGIIIQPSRIVKNYVVKNYCSYVYALYRSLDQIEVVYLSPSLATKT